MGLTTRLWQSGYAENFLTTVPAVIRDQLGLGPADRVVWRVDGSVAELRRAPRPDATGDVATPPEAEVRAPTTYRLYQQSRGHSLYTALPMAVIEQLRLTRRSRAEWELAGDHAVLRRA